MNRLNILVFIFCSVFFTNCKNDKPTNLNDEIIVRLSKDPEKLNPVFNPSPAAREIFQNIFLPLADFHPKDLKLTPILIEAIPSGESAGDNLINYKMRFLADAQWSDGKPITAEDYAFTIKAVKHPETNANAWRAYVNFIKNVIVDPKDPKAFIVQVDKNYMLSLEIATTIYILPRHIYDPQNKLNHLSFDDLMTEENIQKALSRDTIFSSFATEFNAPKNLHTNLVSCGPYQLKEKEANQYYILEKKENYWGDKYPSIPFLNGFIKTLKFAIIPDEMTALTAFKDQSIDLMKMRNSSLFYELQQSEENDQYQFFTPQLMIQQYFALNNKRPELSDVNVRRALAHLMDIQDIIKTIDFGYGLQTVGPFHPSKPYYNQSLSPITYDLEKASDLLKGAGWKDSDGDGDLDKIIDNKLIDLELDLLISGSDLSKKVALLFKNSAEKAGIIINIVAKPFSRIRKENLVNHDFDIVASIQSSDASPDDPYAYWHSDNTDPGEKNIFQYENSSTDAMIEKIRTTRDIGERTQLYLDFQKQIYEDQPVIFMYSPTDKILVNKDFEASATSKRPGYLINTFKSK